ncbi:MAG: hypothetical protein RRZ64_00975 [Rikenellaceae bacterium]
MKYSDIDDYAFGDISVDDIINSSKDNVKIKSKSKILVVGVGGCGGNIVDAMYNGQAEQKKEDIGFLLCNTDEEALGTKKVPMKVILGARVTRGKGAGGDPEIGEQAASDSEMQIRSIFSEFKPDMVFITAGMGGGTGTGAAHVIAGIAADMGILTVGVFTMPFQHEGARKLEFAKKGLEKAKEFLDGRLIINNEELFHCGSITKQKAYAKANAVLIEAASGIADIILTQFSENIDFRDVENAIRGQGLINIGTAFVSKRTPDTPKNLINSILTSPLVADNDIYGSKNIIATVKYGKDGLLISEQQAIMNSISEVTGGKYEMLKFADAYDPAMEDNAIRITLIATGYTGIERAVEEDIAKKGDTDRTKGRIKKIFELTHDTHRIGRHRTESDVDKEDIPAYKRQKKNITCFVDEGQIEIIELHEE